MSTLEWIAVIALFFFAGDIQAFLAPIVTAD